RDLHASFPTRRSSDLCLLSALPRPRPAENNSLHSGRVQERVSDPSLVPPTIHTADSRGSPPRKPQCSCRRICDSLPEARKCRARSEEHTSELQSRENL